MATQRSQHQRRMRSVQVGLSTAFLLVVTSAGTACSDPDTDAYCGDEQRYVLDEKDCDEGSTAYQSGHAFIYYGSYGGGSAYRVGEKLPDIGTGRVRANDSAGRTKVGLPARGGFGGNGGKISSGG